MQTPVARSQSRWHSAFTLHGPHRAALPPVVPPVEPLLELDDALLLELDDALLLELDDEDALLLLEPVDPVEADDELVAVATPGHAQLPLAASQVRPAAVQLEASTVQLR